MSESYKELQRKLKESYNKRKKLQAELEELEAADKLFREQKATQEVAYKDKISKEKSEAFAIYQKEQTHELNLELQNTENKLVDLQTEHQEKLKEINSYSDINYEGNTDNYNEIKEALLKTSERLSKILGCRFKEELLNQLQKQKITLVPENLEVFINYFNKLNSKLDNLQNNVINKAAAGLEAISNKLDIGRVKSNDLNKVVLFAGGAVLSLFFSFYVLPVYLAALIFIFIFHFYNTYKLYEAIIAFKAVQDNIVEVERVLELQRLNYIDEMLEKENSSFSKKEKQLKQKIAELKTEIENILVDCEKNFTYDTKRSEEQYKSFTDTMQERAKQISVRRIHINDEIQEVKKEINERIDQFGKLTNTMVEDTLNPNIIGTSFIFNIQFLIDFEQNKPLYFTHPLKSCLFLYDDLTDVIDFQKLFVFQLRKEMNPFTFRIHLYDKVFMGADLQIFTDTKYRELFEIITGDKELEALLDDQVSLILKRNTLMKPKTINDYNEEMLATQSVTESYHFNILLDTPENILSKDSFRQLCVIGADVGLYTHLFLNKSDFYSKKEKSLEVIKYINNIYIISNGKITPRAKNFIIDQIKEKSESESTFKKQNSL